MTAFVPSLEPLVGRLAEFTRDRGCKLLHVRVGVELRAAAVELAGAHEHRLDNRAPFLVLEHDHAADAPGWRERIEHARAVHERRREGAEPPIPALPAAPTGGDERAQFALQLQQLLHAGPPGTEGLVVVLAPKFVAEPARWREAIELLLAREALGAVRWIVVETETRVLDAVVAALGPCARQVEARVSNDVAIAALADLASARPPAGPRGVVAPARRDVPSRAPDAEGAKRIALRELVLAAALASARSQPAEAIAAQRRARDLCEGAGWIGESITMELVLGAQLVAAGAAREAEASFLRAIERAREHDRPTQIATAGFGLGATRTIRGERHTALVAYAEAALAAETSGSPVLAIEGSRLAGQAALDLKMEPQAIAFLGRAVRLAEDSGEDVSRSSAPVAARMLAAVCRKRGLPGRAEELEGQALRFARPEDRAAPRVAAPRPVEVPRVEVPRVEVPRVAAPIDEGTAMLTLEEIAKVHWGGVVEDPSPPAEGSRSWTRDEIRVLQHAIDHSLDEDSTGMLVPEELAALRGQSVEPSIVAPPAVVEPPAWVEPPASEPPLAWIEPSASEPAPVRERPRPVAASAEPPPAVDEETALAQALAQLLAQGESRMVMRREDLELIRRKLLAKPDDEG